MPPEIKGHDFEISEDKLLDSSKFTGFMEDTV